MLRVIGWVGLSLLCLVGPSSAQAASGPDGVGGYRQQLARSLALRIKTHLRHALLDGGTVHVSFVVGRDGVVTRSEIAAVSGFEPAADLASRIVPVGLQLPPMPAGLPVDALHVTLPLRLNPIEPRVPASLRDYRRQLTQIFIQRVRGLPHTMPVGGVVRVRFNVERDGVVSRSEIVGPSGLRNIDDLALRIVPAGLRLPPLPADLPHKTMTITLPLRLYRTL